MTYDVCIRFDDFSDYRFFTFFSEYPESTVGFYDDLYECAEDHDFYDFIIVSIDKVV